MIKTSIKQQSNFSLPHTNFNRYNLCFSYSNSKKTQPNEKKGFRDSIKNISTSLPKTPTQSAEINPYNRTSHELSSRAQNKTYYASARQKEACLLMEEQRDASQIQYITNPFPQRKKKSGEHQLIKLLLKYSSHLTSSQKKHDALNMKHPLFNDENPDLKRGIKAKAKNFARLNWIKDRYCANRDKEHGLIQESEGFASQVSFDNALLRANLHPKKLF